MEKKTGSRRTKIILATIGLMLFCCIGVEGILVYSMVNTPSFRSAFNRVSSDAAAMIRLQQEIQAQYPAQSVSVNITNGNILILSLVNLSGLGSSAGEQKEQARQIAQFLKSHYTAIDQIHTIRITFIKQKSVSIFSASQSVTYIFPIGDLDSGSTSG